MMRFWRTCWRYAYRETVDKRIGARRVPPNDWPDVCAPPRLPWDDYEDGPWDLTEKPGIGSEPPLGVPESPRHPIRHDLYWGVQLASGHVIPPAVHGEGRDPRLDLPGSCLVKGPYPPDAKTLDLTQPPGPPSEGLDCMARRSQARQEAGG